MIIGESERLYLREPTLQDAQVFYDLNNDEQVLQYTGDKPFDSVDEARQFLQAYDQFDKYKMGRWIVVRKSDEKVLGWCGLKYHPEDDFVDLGYRLFRTEWNNGYATEASKIAMDVGFSSLQLESIISRAVPANKASIRVMQKLGMHYLGDAVDHGEKIVVYKIERASYRLEKLST